MRQFLRKLLAASFWLLAISAGAQNLRVDGIALARSGLPAAGASISVLTQPATTTSTPGSPLALLCSSATDTVCSSSNPITADGLGNYHFYYKAGQSNYTLQFYGSGLTTTVQPDQNAGATGAYLVDNWATCDGTTDATARINSLIAAAGAGAVIQFPPGKTCKTTSSIIVTNAQVELRCGQAANSFSPSCFIQNTTAGPIVAVSGVTDPQFSIRGFTLVGDQNVAGGAGATIDAISLTGDAAGNLDSVVRDCSFLGVRKAVISKGRNLDVWDNTFANLQIGVYIDTPLGGANRAFKIQRNHFHGTGNADTDADIYINDGNVTDVSVEENTRDQGQYGKFFFAVNGVSRVHVDNNNLDQIRNNGIEFGTASNISIVANHVYGNTLGSGVTRERCISTAALTGAEISTNYCSNIQNDCISVSGVSTAVSITGNTAVDCSQQTANTYDAIVVGNGSSKGYIANNLVGATSLNTRYGINGGTGWRLGPNAVSGTTTANYNGAFDAGDLGRIQLAGAVPTCSITGAGAGATCSVEGGSTDLSGRLQVNTGTGPGNNGVVTLTFSSAYGVSVAPPFCAWSLTNGANSWNARATVIDGPTAGQNTSGAANWDNNAVNLTASTSNSVRFSYVCSGH